MLASNKSNSIIAKLSLIILFFLANIWHLFNFAVRLFTLKNHHYNPHMSFPKNTDDQTNFLTLTGNLFGCCVIVTKKGSIKTNLPFFDFSEEQFFLKGVPPERKEDQSTKLDLVLPHFDGLFWKGNREEQKSFRLRNWRSNRC